MNFSAEIEAGEWASNILRGNEVGLETVNVLIYLEDLKGELLLWASSEGVVEVN